MPMSLELTGVPRQEAQGPSIFVKRDMSDQEAKALVDKHYDSHMRDLPKYAFEQQWFINYLFLLGLQSIPKWGPRGQVTVSPLPTWKRRYIANRIHPLYCRRVSQLTSAQIQWEVRPKSPDYQDLQAASVAKSALFSTQGPIGIESARWEVAGWQTIAGPAHFKVEWDEWADGSKRIYIDPIGRRVIPDEELSPEGKAKLDRLKWFVEQPSGDIRVSAPAPFEIMVPLVASGMSLDSAPWLIHTRQYTMDQMYNRYDPAKVKAVTPEKDMGISAFFQRRLKTIVAQGGYFSSTEDKSEEQLCTVREMWLPPTRMRPEGRLIVCTKDHVLLNVPHPFKDMKIKYPFAKADYSSMPGRYMGKGMIEDLILPQSELNRTSTTLNHIRDTMGQPKWYSEKGSGIGPITSEAGQWLQGKMGAKPPVPLQALIDHQIHQLCRADQLDDINTISAQSDVTQAKIPPSVRSGTAIRSLQEKDDTVITPAIVSQEAALCQTGQMVLRFMARFYKDHRLIAMHGQDRATDIAYFKGSDLRNADRVFIKPGSLMPQSAAVDTETTFEAVQVGILNPQDRNHLRIITKALKYRYADVMWTELEADERMAEIENDRFLAGQLNEPLPEVRNFDDHIAHMQVHNRARKGDRYEYAPPALQEAFDAHCAVHEQFIQAMMEQQMMLQASMKGAPGEKGKASQPSNSGSEEAA